MRVRNDNCFLWFEGSAAMTNKNKLEISKKKKLLLIVPFVLFHYVLFSVEIPKQFKNTIVPFSDISIERLWEAQKDDSSMEDFYYQQNIWKREREYETMLSKNITNNTKLLGNWYLTDLNNQIVDEKRSAPIQFTLLPEGISYRRLSSTSYVYEIEKDSYIIIPTWDAGMIRILRIIDEKIFIYNLDGDFWYLDDIHKNGNYYMRW